MIADIDASLAGANGHRNPVLPDARRRRLLVAAVGAGVGLGVAGATYPILSSMAPSARARAAGASVEADVSKLGPGQLVTVEWRGKPVWIIRRTPDMLSSLSRVVTELRDPGSRSSQQPSYALNSHRSIKPEVFIAIGLCTHLGCVPNYRPELAPADLGDSWQGGMFCPCHGSKFDLAGRVHKGVPAPTNLVIPAHRYVDRNQLVIGEDASAAT